MPEPAPRPPWYQDPIKAGLVFAVLFALAAIARILIAN